MYLNGYEIRTSGESRPVLLLLKWDFGGDKPWTNQLWNKQLQQLIALGKSDYPLRVSDLDNPSVAEIQLDTKTALDQWLKLVFHQR